MCLWRTLIFILDYEVIFSSWKDFLFPFVVYNVDWRKWLTLGTVPFMKIWQFGWQLNFFFFPTWFDCCCDCHRMTRWGGVTIGRNGYQLLVGLHPNQAHRPLMYKVLTCFQLLFKKWQWVMRLLAKVVWQVTHMQTLWLFQRTVQLSQLECRSSPTGRSLKK